MSSPNTDVVKEFYTNDIVYRIDKHNKRLVHGVVLGSYEDTTAADERKSLKKGQLKVLWSNNSRSVVWRQDKVRLLSRSIMPGDIVRRLVHGEQTQRGYCKESVQSVAVQIVGTNKVIEGVLGSRIKKVVPYDINVIVSVKDRGLGKIEDVDQRVMMRSKCGSVVQFTQSLNREVEDLWLRKRNRDYVDMFHPGQEVICAPYLLHQPNWLNKTKVMKRNMHVRQRFTIQKVEPTMVAVSFYDNTGYSVLTDEQLKHTTFLKTVESEYLDLGQRGFLKLTSSDLNFVNKRVWIRKQTIRHLSEFNVTSKMITSGKKLKKKVNNKHVNFSSKTSQLSVDSLESKPNENENDDEWFTEEGSDCDGITDVNINPKMWNCSETQPDDYVLVCNYPPKPSDLVTGRTLPVEILCYESKITVVWQDGTEEKNIPSTELYYAISLDDHEFFPGEWVLLADDNDDTAEKFGVVQNVNHKERTATVKWFKNFDRDNLDSREAPIVINTTEISVYDLKKHTKFAYRPGNNVKSKCSNEPENQIKLGYVRDSCPEGYVMVEWYNGQIENCWPQTIELLLDGSDYLFSESDGDDEDTSGVSWETESVESIAGDVTDETTLQVIASRLDFIRNRIVYLKEAFKNHNVRETFTYLRDLLLVYDNSSYLDKLLDTSFFSPKSWHYQRLMSMVREKGKSWGVEFRGRLFNVDTSSVSGCSAVLINQSQTTASKAAISAEKENINKLVKLEHKINAQLVENQQSKEIASGDSIPTTPEFGTLSTQDNLCVELLSMLKARMDLAYAEIMSRIDGSMASYVMTKALETNSPIGGGKLTFPSVTPLPPTTPEVLNQQPSFALNQSVLDETDNLPGESIKEIVEPEKINLSLANYYKMLDSAPANHRFYGNNKFDPSDRCTFFKAVQKEHKLLKEALLPGVWIRTFCDRLDLLSVMIRGPDKTPYENGLFVFEIKLNSDYPRTPPLCHYISYCSERLNPNLYVEGRVCISLLGTWMGQGTEVWGPNSTLLQLIVSIQGLILVSEPYYNEAGYEKQVDSQQGNENSRTYNEMVVLKMIQSMTEMIRSPPAIFKSEVYQHFSTVGEEMCERLMKFCCQDSDNFQDSKVDFPFLPVSKGLRISLKSALDRFQTTLKRLDDKQE